MNSIEVRIATSKYATTPHALLVVDGEQLDVMLDTACPELNLIGLVPTLLDWLSDPAERELVWTRILPPVGSAAIAPILMCPDDLDLWCTVVVAEVMAEADVVWWHRLGLDTSKPDDMPNSVGTTVRWLKGLGPYCFSRVEYERCLHAFKTWRS